MCTLLESGVGLMMTFPTSLSSSESIPEARVYSLTLTTGRGWLVEKSPWVSHMAREASTWSVANLSELPTCGRKIRSFTQSLFQASISIWLTPFVNSRGFLGKPGSLFREL